MAPLPENDATKRSETVATTTTEGKENPFIKFRRFADAQIGSILQGIIGLPSTFSRSGRNPHWADFKEENSHSATAVGEDALKELADSEVQEKKTAMYQNPLRRFADETAGGEGLRKESIYFPSNETSGRDIPLYSEITKDLFTHLGGLSTKEWGLSSNTIHPPDSLQSKYLPFEIFQGQRANSILQQVQFMAYNELNKRPLLRSNYSLLPYLLFSPYSPIRLEEAAKSPTTRTATKDDKAVDTFPYSIAFEDLLHTTHGAFQKPYKHYHPFEAFHFGSRKQIEPSVNWMGWIHNLYGTNLLQQRETQQSSALRKNDKDYHLSPFAIMHQAINDEAQGNKKSASTLEGADAETEQDLYDELATWITSPSALVGSITSMMQDPERWIEEKLKVLDSEKGQKVARRVMDENLPKEFQEIFGQLKDARLRDNGAVELGRLFDYINGADFARNSEEKAKQLEQLKSIVALILGPEAPHNPRPSTAEQSMWIPDVPNQSRRGEEVQPSSEHAEDLVAKVVATSTTTEQTTHEDGSTETFVTVWKRFSDGRETTTTTNHNTNPACDENGNPVEHADDTNNVAGERRAQEKKGWFWN